MNQINDLIHREKIKSDIDYGRGAIGIERKIAKLSKCEIEEEDWWNHLWWRDCDEDEGLYWLTDIYIRDKSRRDCFSNTSILNLNTSIKVVLMRESIKPLADTKKTQN